ncbi:cilia- and flagella-associated protein 69 [Chanos chanos]|uniref:Cilia- and flagella-associated protein 69 n=1 Tax=Chanos chanos TaxID=29144 RepID=A0A6J2WFN7_CHACN|nr:cilia- and flagella-associated protein 69 [Chanos chanos]
MKPSVTDGSRVYRRKPETPAVKNILKDWDQDRREVAVLDLSRVINLLEDPLQSSFKERHLFVLRRVVKRCERGFLLRDIADIFKILNLCADRVKDHPEYISILCDLLHICRLPFLKERTSDEMNYAQVVSESISQMGYLMRVGDAEVREQICGAIISFYSPVTYKHYPDGLCPTSPGYKIELVERSGLAETLVMSMGLLEKQLSVKLQVLQTLQILSSYSEVNCSLILRAQGAQKICFHMNEPDPSGQVLFRSAEILWNLLEKGSKEEVTSQLSNMDCIMALRDAFLHQLLNGFRHYDQQLRNDLLVITTLIAENPKAPLVESGFAKQLILFVTFPEFKSHNPLVRKFKLSYNNEDFEMKKLLLNLVVVLSKDLSALQLLKEGKVILALMTLIRHTPTDAQPTGRSWSSIQQEELQLQALATLASVAPLLLEDYMTCQGNTCLLMLLEWCTKQDNYFGQGHSFHGTGGRGGKKAHLRHCVRLLRSIGSLGNPEINQDLCDQGAITQLLGVLKQLEEQQGEENSVSMEIKMDIQVIVSSLCEGDLHRKELYGPEIVEMTTHFLRMIPAKLNSGLGHNKLILSTVDCVWSCIVGCYTAEDLFFANGGVFLLLDLLHTCPRNMQSVVLGSLLELCDNPTTLSLILAWRAHGGLTAPRLLLQLWRREEDELGVKRDQHGKITDPKKPMLTSYQEEEPSESLPVNGLSAAVVDVFDNLRAKIYSVFCKLGFEDLPGLDTDDFITLSIVRRYLDFKVGEVWNEISAELALEGVRPVTPDADALETIARTAEDTARKVMAMQQSMLDRQKEKELEEEKLLYTEMRSNRKQKELDAKSWERHVAKTSSYKILKESKKLQEKSIESSRPHTKQEDSVFHSTQISGLQTTNFCGRVLTIESTPAHLTGGPLANTDLALERVPIQGGALQKVTAPAQDLEFQSTVSVK